MSDPVSNVQIEDVLASIRRLVSEEVRAQTQPAEAKKEPTAFRRPDQQAAAEPVPAAPEKLILAPHLRVADPVPAPQESDDAALFEAVSGDDNSYEDSPEDEAPFEAVSDEEALSGFAEAPLSFIPAAAEETPEEDLGNAFAPDAEAEPFQAVDDFDAFDPDQEDQPGEEPGTAEEIDFDEMLASLKASHETSTDFADFGDGAAEALAAARHHVEEDSLSEAERDAQFDDLDAVLSHLEFDVTPEAEPHHTLRAEIEDAEIVEEGAGIGENFESLFRRREAAPASGLRVVRPDDADPSQDIDFLDGPALGDLPEAEFDAMPEHDSLSGQAAAEGDLDDPYADGEDPNSITVDEDVLRDLVSEILRQELQGALGERITRNVRKLVRREIQRALQSQDYI